jgi:hypothetical protein
VQNVRNGSFPAVPTMAAVRQVNLNKRTLALPVD